MEYKQQLEYHEHFQHWISVMTSCRNVGVVGRSPKKPPLEKTLKNPLTSPLNYCEPGEHLSTLKKMY